MIQHFADLRKNEFEALIPDLTVFLFSFGGLEQHGNHLPLGTRWVIAEQSTRTLAEILQAKMPQWNFILMPTYPLTVDTVTTKVAFPVRAHVVRDLVVDQANALKRLGFNKFAIYSSHLTPRQLVTLEEASIMVRRKKFMFLGKSTQMVSITSADVSSREIMNSPMIPNPKEHGGAQDTALMLAYRINKVSSDYTLLPEKLWEKQNMKRLFQYFRHEIDGYWGKPAAAMPEEEKNQLRTKLEKTASMLQSVFESGQGGSLFHSGYRYFFFNGSFFKAYLLGAIFFVMMVIWTMWSLRDVFEP